MSFRKKNRRWRCVRCNMLWTLDELKAYNCPNCGAPVRISGMLG